MKPYMVEAITEFSGAYRWLSNFYPSEIKMPDEIIYPTAEHAYQAYKVLEIPRRLEMVDARLSPGKAKRWSRTRKMRSDWDMIKLNHMLLVVRLKFQQHAGLATRLGDTGLVTLVESNTWGDKYWGQVDGEGLNMLGNVLMIVRSGIFESYRRGLLE